MSNVSRLLRALPIRRADYRFDLRELTADASELLVATFRRKYGVIHMRPVGSPSYAPRSARACKPDAYRACRADLREAFDYVGGVPEHVRFDTADISSEAEE